MKNEKITLRASLNSIVPAIQRGIIAYHECDDSSQEIILDFCKKHPGFIAYQYPYPVRPVTQEEAAGMGVKTLHEYYNDVLDQIPEGQWLIKIDCDQVYDAAKLFKSFYLALGHDDAAVAYQRLDLHYDPETRELFMRKDEPLIEPFDHWLIRKDRIHFKEYKCNQEEILRYGQQKEAVQICEIIQIMRPVRWIRTELNTWHFPSLKLSRPAQPHIWQTFDPTAFASKIKRVDQHMLNRERILNICRKFEFKNSYK